MIEQKCVYFPEHRLPNIACCREDLSQQGVFKTDSHTFRYSTTKQKCARLPRNNLDHWQTGLPAGL